MLSLMLADDLIVDQASISQYDKDSYIFFDSFDFHGTYHGNNAQQEDGSFPYPIDRIYLPEDFPIAFYQLEIPILVNRIMIIIQSRIMFLTVVLLSLNVVT